MSASFRGRKKPASSIITPKAMICDFCSDPNVRWGYPANDYLSEVCPVANSIGGWAACQECHDFIEAGDWAGLAVRDADKFPLPIPYEDKVALARAIHIEFQKQRSGPAYPVEA